jgi:hypothetical protein
VEAFEVLVNGHRLAGIADGVLSAIVNCVGGPEQERHLFMSVGGLDSVLPNEHAASEPREGIEGEILRR